MKTSGSELTPPIDMEQQLREINEALLVSSIRQHELTEQAQLAEAALRRSERELSDFFETASVGLHSVGPDGVILRVNQAELDLLGYRREEYVGHHIAEFHVDQLVIEDILARLRRGESLYDYPARLRSKDGSIRDVLINSSVLFENGEFIHTRCFTHDITERKRAEAANARLAAIVESSDDAIISKDLDGIIISWNEGAQSLFGYTPQEAIGKPVTMLMPPDRLDEEPGILEHVRRGEVVDHYETVRQRKDGSLLDVSLTVSPIRDAQGQIIGASKIARDISERKSAELLLRESEARFRMVADNISQLAWTCDYLGNVTWYNQRWLDYTGLSFDEMKGWDWSKVQHPDHLERVVERVKRSAETGEPWDDTFPLRGKDGQYRWFLSRAVPIRDEAGDIVRWFGTNTDVEDLKQAREAAETANRVKDEFLATVSHELRTPLNAIMGWTHMLMRGRLDEETAARGLKSVARNASAQNQLISDLLDVSRIISGQFRFESGVVDLIPVIEAATETVRPAANAKGIVLHLKLDSAAGLVSGDGARLQQIVWNLLTNAVKFTSRDGHVEVRLKRQDTSVAIVVNDSGEGISPEFLPHMFDRFRQAESTTKRQHGGLGLGLAIVRHLVEAHGGTIRAASKGLGQGATFTVTLPLIAVSRDGSGGDHTEAGKGSPDHASPTILEGLRVLVIDDEPDARELLTIALRQSGAKVRSAATVQLALDILDQWKPDVLVSDIGMPGEDGYDLIRRVRALESKRGGTIPALALTGYASAEDAMRAREAGFQTHMSKPVAPVDLVVAVASLAAEGPPPM